MKNGIFDLNTTDYTQIGLARQSLQDLTGLVNLRIANTDYSDVPGRGDLDHQRLVGRHGGRAVVPAQGRERRRDRLLVPRRRARPGRTTTRSRC